MPKLKSSWPDSVMVVDASKVFRVTAKTMNQWFGDGCPRGPGGNLSLGDVHAWLMAREKNRNVDGEGLHKQKLEKEIEHLTAKINKVNESVIPIEQHDNVLRNLASSMKKFLESAVNKNYHQLANRSPEEMHVMLMEFMRQIMKVWIGGK